MVVPAPAQNTCAAGALSCSPAPAARGRRPAPRSFGLPYRQAAVCLNRSSYRYPYLVPILKICWLLAPIMRSACHRRQPQSRIARGTGLLAALLATRRRTRLAAHPTTGANRRHAWVELRNERRAEHCFAHDREVYSVAFSAHGRWLASGDGAKKLVARCHQRRAEALLHAPWRGQVRGVFRRWALARERRQREEAHRGDATSGRSTASRTVAVVRGVFRRWALARERPLRVQAHRARCHQRRAEALPRTVARSVRGVSADGRWLASGDDAKKLIVRDAAAASRSTASRTIATCIPWRFPQMGAGSRAATLR